MSVMPRSQGNISPSNHSSRPCNISPEYGHHRSIQSPISKSRFSLRLFQPERPNSRIQPLSEGGGKISCHNRLSVDNPPRNLSTISPPSNEASHHANRRHPPRHWYAQPQKCCRRETPSPIPLPLHRVLPAPTTRVSNILSSEKPPPLRPGKLIQSSPLPRGLVGI
jgi:hypothetical protein